MATTIMKKKNFYHMKDSKLTWTMPRPPEEATTLLPHSHFSLIWRKENNRSSILLLMTSPPASPQHTTAPSITSNMPARQVGLWHTRTSRDAFRNCISAAAGTLSFPSPHAAGWSSCRRRAQDAPRISAVYGSAPGKLPRSSLVLLSPVLSLSS